MFPKIFEKSLTLPFFSIKLHRDARLAPEINRRVYTPPGARAPGGAILYALRFYAYCGTPILHHIGGLHKVWDGLMIRGTTPPVATASTYTKVVTVLFGITVATRPPGEVSPQIPPLRRHQLLSIPQITARQRAATISRKEGIFVLNCQSIFRRCILPAVTYFL